MVALSYLLVAAWLLLVTRAQSTPVAAHRSEPDEADAPESAPVAVASQV